MGTSRRLTERLCRVCPDLAIEDVQLSSHMPVLLHHRRMLCNTILNYEMAAAVSSFLDRYGAPVKFDELVRRASPGIEGILKALVLPPNRPTQSAYLQAIQDRAKLIDELNNFVRANEIAALMFPSILVPPPKIGDARSYLLQGKTFPLYLALSRNVCFGSCAKMASLLLPAGLTTEGLPVGIEFAGINGTDANMLSLGYGLQKVFGRIKIPSLAS